MVCHDCGNVDMREVELYLFYCPVCGNIQTDWDAWAEDQMYEDNGFDHIAGDNLMTDKEWSDFEEGLF